MNTDKLMELAEQLRRELHSHDAAYSYTQYEQGRVDEKRRTLELLAAALRAEQAVGEEQRARELLAEELRKIGPETMNPDGLNRVADSVLDGTYRFCVLTAAIRAIRRALGTARQSEGVVPDYLFDGYSVYENLTPDAKRFVSADAVSAVLDACARVGRKIAAAPGGEGEVDRG